MDILITHAECPDGKACAAVARLNYPSCKIIYCDHGDELDLSQIKGLDVVVADFSFPRQQVLKLREITNSLLIIDHHKSVEAELQGLEFCIFDMNRCGSMLLWNYLNPDRIDQPQFLWYIQDRDIWSWKLPDSKVFLEGLDMTDWGLSDWSEAIANPDPVKMERLKESGRVAIKYKRSIIEKILKGSFPARITGVNNEEFSVMAVNSSVFSSDLGHELAIMPENGSNIGVIFTLQDNLKWKYSLRSLDNIDTTRISQNYGGGGHKNASGFCCQDFVLRQK